MAQLINRDNVRLAIGLQLLNITVLIIGLICLGNFTSDVHGINFLHIGPGTPKIPINLLGFNINTWGKWSILIGFLLLSEMINTFSGKIYNNWYKNIVSDPKSDSIGMDNKEAAYIINIWDVTTWISKLFKWSIFIFTKQLQFMLPQFVAYLVVANSINRSYIYSKKGSLVHKHLI